MPALLPIVQLGNPVLRQVAQPVTQIQDETLQALIDHLLASMLNQQGVGIAAPQVAIPLQLLIVASRPNARYPDAPLMEPTVMMNPRLLSHSDEQVKGWEGCLSVPGIRGLVPRYQAITIEYQDRQGNLITQELTGFVARIFQHEFDHLQGFVFLDHVESTQDLMSEQEYQARIIQADAAVSSNT